MNKDKLYGFHEDQMNIIKNDRVRLVNQGFVKTYRDIYPDIYERIRDCKTIAYIRGQVSLKLMSLLYDKVIIYIPPFSEKVLLRRFQLLDWDELIRLCQNNIVIPIIGNSINYTASHFDRLFNDLLYKPYSLWARGIALLDVFDMDDSLEKSSEYLPVKAISENEEIVFHWKKKYPGRSEEFIKKRIQDDVAVMYADLCIFGLKNSVEKLSGLTIPQIYHGLQTINEVQTYPILFGLESQPNFSVESIAKLDASLTLTPTITPQEIPDNDLKILFEGIGIDVEQISVDDIKQYRFDGVGKLLRSALFSFNNYIDIATHKGDTLDLTEIFTRAEVFEKLLREGIDEISDGRRFAALDNAEKSTVNFLKIGTIVAGGLVLCDPSTSQPMSVASVAATFGAIISAMPERIAHYLVNSWAKGVHSTFVANTWQVSKIVRGNNES